MQRDGSLLAENPLRYNLAHQASIAHVFPMYIYHICYLIVPWNTGRVLSYLVLQHSMLLSPARHGACIPSCHGRLTFNDLVPGPSAGSVEERMAKGPGRSIKALRDISPPSALVPH